LELDPTYLVRLLQVQAVELDPEEAIHHTTKAFKGASDVEINEAISVIQQHVSALNLIGGALVMARINNV